MKASMNWPLSISPALYSDSLTNTSCVQVCSCIVVFTHPSIHPPIHTFLQQMYTKYLLWASLVLDAGDKQWMRKTMSFPIYRVSTSLPCSSMPQCLCTCCLPCLKLIYSSRPSSNITSSFSSKVYAFLNFIHPLQRLTFNINISFY